MLKPKVAGIGLLSTGGRCVCVCYVHNEVRYEELWFVSVRVEVLCSFSDRSSWFCMLTVSVVRETVERCLRADVHDCTRHRIEYGILRLGGKSEVCPNTSD